MINYWFLTTETNLEYISLFFNTTSSVKQFVVTVQIFVYKCLFTIVLFGKRKKNTHETHHICFDIICTTYIFLSDSDCPFHHMPVNCFGTGWGGQRTLVVVVRSASLVQESRHIDSSRRRFSELISRVNNCLGCSNDILKTNFITYLII